jgi:hypothetical protein
MYQPEEFMTLDVVTEIVSQFEWPAEYELEDELPDGVLLVFPRCRLLLVEGFESDISIKFVARDTGLSTSLTLGEALLSVTGGGPLPEPRPKLVGDDSPSASLEKVKHGLQDQCALVLAYFRPCLLGDFSWVEAYKAYYARKRG